MSSRSRLHERLSPLLQSFKDNGPPGCACTVVRRGEVLYQETMGYANLENERLIAPDTLYRIYSMTKVVTCAAALILFERGLYLLNDPLEEYLPEYKDLQVYRNHESGNKMISPATGSIRVKDLFTMTSGLVYGGEQTEIERRTQKIIGAGITDLDTRDVARELAQVPLAFDPGTHWRYGTSHDVLAALIETLSGQRFGAFLQKEIFDPLGMSDTSFKIRQDQQGRLCTLYDRGDDGSLKSNDRLDGFYQPECKFESGGFGLISTIGDYSRFAQALAGAGKLDGERILSPKTVQLMGTNHLSLQQLKEFNNPGYGYGLGVRVMIDPAAGGINGSVGEFGWAGLAGTYLLIDPKEELSVVYMQQMMPSMEQYIHPRLRAVIYGALD
ncbi:beta-lactamase family protein [Paenibacillus sp. sptzw28]|uniref:serine hydrolase domain-containing protein n=1 Tax=Paenibacillus sp. sptzw28 TaxID=715179 RepID=UPI001C6F0A6D|nr:serine hydrolase domain-containing protein [Paenibacillus sp. sptzw28]QYR21756.1 beta-lactamase family protein [Paenibacillus sp. sptzw28]